MQYASLFLFHFIYFVMIGASTFLSKFYGDIGMTSGQIGLLSSVPTLVSLAFIPAIGSLTDRMPRKRYLLSILLAAMAGMCFLIGQFRQFLPLIVSVSVYTLFAQSARPVSNAIALEYTYTANKPYGPIRLMGTVGYQLGALLVGWVLSKSLDSLYPLKGTALLATFVVSFAMPNIEGHQHAKEKVPIRLLFRDRHVTWLYALIFIAAITTQFYAAFYSRYMGDLGFTNAQISWITLFSVMAELPFLVFADRIGRLTNIWVWLLIGFVTNGVRWLGLAFARSIPLIVAFQIPGVTVLACFEFFPAIYLTRRVPPEQSGIAQTMLSLTIFGAGNIVGSMLGGQLCERVGIGTMFAANGALLLIATLCILPLALKLMREEAREGAQNK
ncbi:MAG: MFS transporter [Clostridia bacterium]|nr:MFS transporter [Clostridia bacterium]